MKKQKVQFNFSFARQLLMLHWQRQAQSNADKFEAQQRAVNMSRFDVQRELLNYLLNLSDDARLNTVRLMQENGIKPKPKKKKKK